MPTEASAVTTVDSATTQTVDQTQTQEVTRDWTPTELAEWNKTGAIPRLPKKADSATATDKKDSTPADSSTAQRKTADTASDSATDKQQPHLKTKEDTDKRFKEILDENKALQRRLESLERGKSSDTRDTKQESQPAAEVYKPLDENEFFKGNPEKGMSGHKTYGDFVRAAAKHEAKWEVKQEIALENQRRAQADAQKELSTRVEEAKKRYPDFNERIQPAVKAITDDQQIPYAVKAILNDSPVFVDLIYVLAEPKALADLVQTAKTNPAAAIRKIVLTEQLVQAELAKAKSGEKTETKGDDKSGETKRDASGKFVKESSEEKKDAAEPKPRAPKPPAEVGGRGAASEAADVAAARSGNFRDFEAEQNRKLRAALS